MSVRSVRGPGAHGLRPCPHRPPCPGCPRYGEAGLAPAALETLAELARASGLPPPVVEEGAAEGFRLRARLMLRGRAGAPKLGLFEAGSHRVVDVPQCRVHHPRLNQVAAAVKRTLRAQRTPPYADRPHAGLVRAIQIVIERTSGRAQLVVVANESEPGPASRLLLDALAESEADALQGLFWNGNPTRGNVILGPGMRLWRGAETTRERIGGADVFFPPAAFGQSQLDLADRLVAHVHALVPAGARVLELHAGCGAIGLGLAARGHAVACNERSAAALDGLARGIAALPEAARARVETLPGEAGLYAARLRDCDLVITDPPRKGLEPALLAALVATPPPRLVAVSCGLAAFVREARTLRDAGLRITSLRAFALAPYTEHAETVALFERV